MHAQKNLNPLPSQLLADDSNDDFSAQEEEKRTNETTTRTNDRRPSVDGVWGAHKDPVASRKPKVSFLPAAGDAADEKERRRHGAH